MPIFYGPPYCAAPCPTLCLILEPTLLPYDPSDYKLLLLCQSIGVSWLVLCFLTDTGSAGSQVKTIPSFCHLRTFSYRCQGLNLDLLYAKHVLFIQVMACLLVNMFVSLFRTAKWSASPFPTSSRSSSQQPHGCSSHLFVELQKDLSMKAQPKVPNEVK